MSVSRSTSASQPAAPRRNRRGDLVIVERRPTHSAVRSADGAELASEYEVMVATNLTREGAIKMVRPLTASETSTPLKLEGMLHATGRRWIIPKGEISLADATAAALAHTFPRSSTPRPFPSLDAVREALRPHHIPSADGIENITRDDVADGVAEALKWLPRTGRERAEKQPASKVLAAEYARVGRVMRPLLKKGGRVPVETQVVRHYSRVEQLLRAARRFEALDSSAA